MVATWMRNADMINPEILAPYMIERSILSNRFLASGVATFNQELLNMMLAGGITGKLPFYKPLSGDDEVLGDDDGEALTPGKTTTASEKYSVLARGRAFSASDLAKAFSGDDPLKAMASMMGDYWAGRYTAALIASLKGLFSNSSMAGLVHDITTSGDGKITSNAVIDAKGKLGDASGKLSAIAVNSAVRDKLAKDQLIDYVRDQNLDINIPFYLGMEVIVDDSLPKDVSDNYTSYLFAPDAVAFASNAAPVPLEYDRDSLAGLDVVVTRNHFVMHPRGSSVNISGIDGETATNTELGGDIWSRVFEVKNMGIVQFLHKI